MRPILPRIQPDTADPIRYQARILACGDACFGTATACEQELAGLFVGGLQIIIDRLASLFAQFKSDRSTGLLLTYSCAIRSVSASGDIVDFDRHDIAAAKLAVDRQIEHGEVSDAAFNLKLRPDRPDMFGPQWRLCSRQLALIPRRLPADRRDSGL